MARSFTEVSRAVNQRMIWSLGLAFAVAGVTPPPAAAQTTQSVIDPPAAGGACGQPNALSHVMPLALNSVPAAPATLTLQRFEPRYVVFTLLERSRVTLRTGTPAAGDPFLTLYDSTGETLEWDDDGGEGLNSVLESDLGPGTYCAQVRLLAGTPQLATVVTLELAAGMAGADDPGVVPSTGPCENPDLTTVASLPLAPGMPRMTLPGTIEPDLHRDWLFTATDQVRLQIDAESDEFDTVLTVYDESGGEIAENDDRPGGGTDSRIVETLSPGNHCVSIRGFAGSGGKATLTLVDADNGDTDTDGPGPGFDPDVGPDDETDEDATDDDAAAEPGADARIIELGTLNDTLSGSENTTDRIRWAAFELPEPATVRVQGLSVGGPFTMRLLDADNRVIGESGASGGMDIAAIEADLAAGRHVIGVTLDAPPGRMQLHQIEVARADTP